ncbi:MAG: glycosyltransferase [Treponema sp.]|nr:glycosyltransferase [Treponema sp.]
MQEITFSVAVITYNQEEYISQTLDSILNQQHDYKYEIVVGEDCSTDNTKKIIEEYVEKYPEIIKPLYNNPNKGLIKNYFNVINHCQGKYIMECAGDDYWLPGKVAKQIEFMENNPTVGMCYGRAKYFDIYAKKYLKQTFGKKNETFMTMIQDNTVPALTVCIRTTVLNQYMQDIDPIKMNWLMEDYPTWIWISRNSKIRFLNSIFGVYRIGQDSISLGKSIEKKIEFNKNYHNIKTYFAKLYSVKVPNWDENISKFYILYEELENYYSKEIKRKLHNAYKSISNKNFKTKLFYFSSRTKGTFLIMSLLKKLRNTIKI